MGAKAVKTDGHSSIEHSALTQWWALRLLWHLDWNFGLWNRKGTASGLVLGARLEYQTQQRWNWSLTSVLGQWDWTLYWRMGVHRDIRHNKDRMDQQRRRSVSIVRGVKPGTSLLHAVRETQRNLERRTDREDIEHQTVCWMLINIHTINCIQLYCCSLRDIHFLQKAAFC